MKKFMKFGMIGAGIAAALGIVLMIVGTIMGATLSSLADSLNSNAFVIEMEDYLSGLYAAAPTESVTIVDMGTPETWPAHGGHHTETEHVMMGEEHHGIHDSYMGGQVLGCWDASEVTSIDFEFATGNLEIIPLYDGNQIILETMSPVAITGSSLNNGYLELDMESGNDPILYLIIPENMTLDFIKLDVDAGHINCQSLYVNNLNVDMDLGSFYADDLQISNAFDVDMDAGDLDVYNAYCKKLNISNDAGNVCFTGCVEGNISLETDAGAVDMILSASSKDYNYDLNCDLGTIMLDGYEISGIGNSYTIDNGASYQLQAECNLGMISIYFE